MVLFWRFFMGLRTLLIHKVAKLDIYKRLTLFESLANFKKIKWKKRKLYIIERRLA